MAWEVYNNVFNMSTTDKNNIIQHFSHDIMINNFLFIFK